MGRYWIHVSFRTFNWNLVIDLDFQKLVLESVELEKCTKVVASIELVHMLQNITLEALALC